MQSADKPQQRQFSLGCFAGYNTQSALPCQLSVTFNVLHVYSLKTFALSVDLWPAKAPRSGLEILQTDDL
jgi:hypothetical protein